MSKTKIEWTHRPGTTGASWNPVTGCTKISPGCAHCYAERMARRLAGRSGYPEYPNHFDVVLRPDRLEKPLRWKKPRTVFVCSMSDLFHEDVPFEYIGDVLGLAANLPQHTFQVLTKRPGRMLEFYRARERWNATPIKPPANIWLGISAENQETADERIPILLQTPAAVRFVSCEPMLGAIRLSVYLRCPTCGMRDWNFHKFQAGHLHIRGLDWVICGSESGLGARPMDEDWVREVRDQCVTAGVAFFYKQKLVGGRKVSCPELDGKRWTEFPHGKGG